MELRARENKVDKEVFEELCGTIGRECVFDSIEERECYPLDVTNVKSIPDLVVMPHSTEQVSSILSIANKHNIPICTRGAGDVLPGGAVFIRGGIALDLKNMNRIVELNARDLMVTVEPGVVTKDLHDEVEKFRLFYPPESGNAGLSTIGERVAECTGGTTGMKYGVTRDYVLALEVVLPDGSVINVGRKTLKSVAGYDLTRFFVGSEWTLGVFTRITLKLLPMPEKIGTVMSCFEDVESARNVTDSILVKSHLNPRALEFADKICIDAVRETDKEKIPDEAEALLLIEIDGNEKNVTNDISGIDAICRENNALNTLIVYTDEERNRLCDIRKSILPSLFKVTSVRFNRRTNMSELTPHEAGIMKDLKKMFDPKGIMN